LHANAALIEHLYASFARRDAAAMSACYAADAHFRDTGHPVIESAEPGEDWRWCYLDHVTG